MRRREFIAGLGGAAAWPLVARAQQPVMPVVGFVHYASADTTARSVASFREGLREVGFLEGQNVAIEYRWAEGQYDRLPDILKELIDQRVAVIVTGGGSSVALAAKNATSAKPIVFVVGVDPVRAGLAASLSRPGGNLTGVNVFAGEMTVKLIELIDQLVPKSAPLAFMVNPLNAYVEEEEARALTAARALARQLVVVPAGSESEIEPGFAEMVKRQVGGLVILNEGFFVTHLPRLAALAMRHRIPAASAQPDFAVAGGLISYGPSVAESFRVAGGYAGRIIKGAKIADLPVQQSTTFELAINLKTAKALGIDIPAALLARADEVIE